MKNLSTTNGHQIQVRKNWYQHHNNKSVFTATAIATAIATATAAVAAAAINHEQSVTLLLHDFIYQLSKDLWPHNDSGNNV